MEQISGEIDCASGDGLLLFLVFTADLTRFSRWCRFRVRQIVLVETDYYYSLSLPQILADLADGPDFG